jgi:hypothetical protein
MGRAGGGHGWIEYLSTVSTSRYLPPPRSIHNLKETEEKEKKRFLPPSTQAITGPR